MPHDGVALVEPPGAAAAAAAPLGADLAAEAVAADLWTKRGGVSRALAPPPATSPGEGRMTVAAAAAAATAANAGSSGCRRSSPSAEDSEESGRAKESTAGSTAVRGATGREGVQGWACAMALWLIWGPGRRVHRDWAVATGCGVNLEAPAVTGSCGNRERSKRLWRSWEL